MIWDITESILLIYFSYVSFYSFILAMAGRFLYKEPEIKPPLSNDPSIILMIPGYKEDSIILDTINNALKLNYPKNRIDTLVIADSFSEKTIVELNKLNVILLEVKFKESTKVKSLKKAFESLENEYDIAIIIDADNIIKVDFCTIISQLYLKGYKSIQGHRMAKNNNTALSVLDGLSEEINTHVFKKGTVALGGSSSLAGSGMAFDFELLKQKINSMNSIGGFDRELELKILEDGIKSYYCKQAIVYDHKVESSKVFSKQRTRWISSQYVYLKKYILAGVISLLHGNISYFNSSVLRNIQLPRLLNLGFLTLLGIIAILPLTGSYFRTEFWIFLWVLFIQSLILSIPKSYYNKKTALAILKLPNVFLSMILIMFKLKGANKKFIHTPHSNSESKS